MLHRLSSWLSNISTGQVALISVLVFVLFTVLVLPSQAANSTSQASEAGSPDLSFYYSLTELYRMAESYGQAGREDYIRVRFTFDLIWPFVYGFFLVVSVSWLLKNTFPAESKWQRANLLPLAGVIFDYLENISTSLVMGRYPAQTPVVDWMAGIFTAFKWITIGGSFAILVGALVLAIWEKVTREGVPPENKNG
jgi:hypothetical protein